MSINWVMIAPDSPGFVKLPNERLIYTSPPRTSLELTASSPNPQTRLFSIKSDAGVVYVTNQRLVYLPTVPTSTFKSFSCPILNLQDTHVCSPLFGPNYWVGQCQPVPGGGIPANYLFADLKLTFREGGTYDFVTAFEQIKEHLYQARSTAQETSTYGMHQTNIDLEQLPAYQRERGTGPDYIYSPSSEAGAPQLSVSVNSSPMIDPLLPIPGEAPPGYEEVQAQAVILDLEQRLRARCQ
ncbi:hypothetical protein K3495_g8582 [Podosphaera aphanis]|nr:hypothetical protein K3495_g8582 [Podosphaera aphanis]